MATRKNATKQKQKAATTSRRSSTKLSALKDLPDNFIECRSYNVHLMKKSGLFYWRDTDGSGTCRISTCQLCGTIREDYHHSNGKLMDRRYYHPEGYLLEGRGRRPRSDEVYREMLSRSDIAADRESVPGAKAILRLVGG